jgi:lycopene epsilon-cyclase
MIFMDYRDYNIQDTKKSAFEEIPTFLYAMPLSPTRVFFEVHLTCLIQTSFHGDDGNHCPVYVIAVLRWNHCLILFSQETCLAARPALPFSLLRERLEARLEKMGIKVIHMHEEVSSVQSSSHFVLEE